MKLPSLMGILLIVNLIVEVIFTCLIPHTKAIFFDELQIFSQGAWLGLFYYIGVYVLLDVIQNLKPLLITLYTNVRRRFLTEYYWDKGKEVSTRSQRIQEDVKLYTINQTTVYSEYFISGSIVVFLIFQNINYPFLIFSSLIYSVLCVGAAYLFKPKMIKAEKEIQQIETEFRDIARTTTTWDNVKLFFNRVVGTNISNAKIKFNYGLCVKLQTGLMTLLPYIYLLPLYLAKQITLGVMMEQAAIFQLLVINMIILTQLFPTWMQAHASKERLEELT